MVKLIFSTKYPYIRLTDVGLRRQVDQLRQTNQELRDRLIAAQEEKANAQKQAEAARKEKDRLRLKVASQKESSEDQRKAHDALKTKIQELREENEKLKNHRVKFKP